MGGGGVVDVGHGHADLTAVVANDQVNWDAVARSGQRDNLEIAGSTGSKWAERSFSSYGVNKQLHGSKLSHQRQVKISIGFYWSKNKRNYFL